MTPLLENQLEFCGSKNNNLQIKTMKNFHLLLMYCIKIIWFLPNYSIKPLPHETHLCTQRALLEVYCNVSKLNVMAGCYVTLFYWLPLGIDWLWIGIQTTDLMAILTTLLKWPCHLVHWHGHFWSVAKINLNVQWYEEEEEEEHKDDDDDDDDDNNNEYDENNYKIELIFLKIWLS